MEFLYELGLFAAQTLLIVLGIVAIIMVIAASAGHKSKGTDEGFIEVRSINDRLDGYTAAIRELSDTDEVAKARAKLDKKAEKERVGRPNQWQWPLSQGGRQVAGDNTAGRGQV